MTEQEEQKTFESKPDETKKGINRKIVSVELPKKEKKDKKQ